MQHLGDGRQAIRRATGVGDALEFRSQLVIVDAHDTGQIRAILSRSAEHNTFGAGGEVRVVTRFVAGAAGGEDARTFHHHIDFQLAPGQIRRIAFSKRTDRPSVDDQVGVVVIHRPVKTAVDTVVFQQRR